ncbi:MAG: hypothetical protein NT040_10470 [Bacteroidetes bacterium]|nr:hypothetical protein [Bacteroidota bacterium]
MALHSYHIFMFPFQWEHDRCRDKPFNERFDLNKVHVDNDSMWENLPVPKNDQYETELYNEKNFFYKFVHNVLYDTGKTGNPIIRHFERKETYNGELTFKIGVKAGKENIYNLKIKSIGIDLFSTGTGILIFYLENHLYNNIVDVKRINQFGRRVFPPYMVDGTGVAGTKTGELADYIAIDGLSGEPSRYFEDFNQFTALDIYKPARFIKSLIEDLDKTILPEPVVDDRMFTMCWFFDNETSELIKSDTSYEEYAISNDWHEYLYIDSNGSTCQNKKMQKKLLEDHTYARWQKEGTLYGITRYSFIAISNEGWFAQNVLLTHFRTMYVRMVELVLVQRASTLKFSSEVTMLSSLSDKDPQRLADNIGKFYQAYIRFVNQVYFREITAQEQGIELYEMLQISLHMKDQVKDLDEEIGELHNYAALLDDKRQNQNLSLLTKIGALFIAPSLIASYFGMNILQINGNNPVAFSQIWVFGSFIVLSGLILWLTKTPNKTIVNWLYALIALILLATFLLPFLLPLMIK